MKRYYPWLIAGCISLLGIIQTVIRAADAATLDNYIFEFAVAVVIALFSFMGALIVIRQEGNLVGWLMIAGAFAFTEPFSFLVTLYPKPPTILTPGLWLLLWIESWFFILGIISIFQIVLHFPNGHLSSARWKWINMVTIVTLLLIALLTMFSDQVGPTTGVWAVKNPLGFLSPLVLQGLTLLAAAGMIILAGGSLISLFIRFRRGSFIERQQIKWLFFAGAVFIFAVVLLLRYWEALPTTTYISWQEFFFLISVLFFPIAIANAILRYRLYEIDIIIRRTLVYGLLTGTLALIYFSSVIVLQQILQRVTGQRSPIVIVLSTLIIAALFSPLRRRIQEFIDRRFYRRQYDAVETLAQFALFVQDEVSIEPLVDELLQIVDRTMNPEHLSLWLKED